MISQGWKLRWHRSVDCSLLCTPAHQWDNLCSSIIALIRAYTRIFPPFSNAPLSRGTDMINVRLHTRTPAPRVSGVWKMRLLSLHVSLISYADVTLSYLVEHIIRNCYHFCAFHISKVLLFYFVALCVFVRGQCCVYHIKYGWCCFGRILAGLFSVNITVDQLSISLRSDSAILWLTSCQGRAAILLFE